jgi:hypothetical protein
MKQKIDWPGGRISPSPSSTIPISNMVETTIAMHSFLADIGLRTTKAVWPV